MKQLEPPKYWARFYLGILQNGKRCWSAGELGIIIETHFEEGMRCPEHHISFSLRSGNTPTDKLCLKMANMVKTGNWEIDNQYSERKNIQHLWLQDPAWPREDDEARRAVKKKNNTYLNCNNGYLECYTCGDWFDYNGKILPASIDFACAVMGAFNDTHAHDYEQTAKGRKLEQAAKELNEHVSKIMAENGLTQDDVDQGKGQGILPGEIKKFMMRNGSWVES